jgi:hypothetical protein
VGLDQESPSACDKSKPEPQHPKHHPASGYLPRLRAIRTYLQLQADDAAIAEAQGLAEAVGQHATAAR